MLFLTAISMLVSVSSEIDAQSKTEPPMFLNPKMQRQYEEESKTADVNVSRAVVAYSRLREILCSLKTQGDFLRHYDSQTEPDLLNELNIYNLGYYPGYATFQSVEGKRWEDISESEPVIQFVDSIGMFAVDKNGIEIEEFVPDSHIFLNPKKREEYQHLSLEDRLAVSLQQKQYTRLRLLLAYIKEKNHSVVDRFDSELKSDDDIRIWISIRKGEQFRVVSSVVGKSWTDLKDGEAVVELSSSTGRYAVDKRGFEIVGDKG